MHSAQRVLSVMDSIIDSTVKNSGLWNYFNSVIWTWNDFLSHNEYPVFFQIFFFVMKHCYAISKISTGQCDLECNLCSHLDYTKSHLYRFREDYKSHFNSNTFNLVFFLHNIIKLVNIFSWFSLLKPEHLLSPSSRLFCAGYQVQLISLIAQQHIYS